jgi:uncharacterized protein (TIGR02145 family)
MAVHIHGNRSNSTSTKPITPIKNYSFVCSHGKHIVRMPATTYSVIDRSKYYSKQVSADLNLLDVDTLLNREEEYYIESSIPLKVLPCEPYEESSHIDRPIASPATNITMVSFTANWRRSHDATGYVLEVNTHSDFDPMYMETYIIYGSTTLSLDIFNMPSSTVLYYRIRSFNNLFVSVYSNVIQLITLAPIVYPFPPVALPATEITVNSFKANWTTVVNATGYYLYVSTDINFPPESTHVYYQEGNGNISRILYGLDNLLTYYYRLTSYDDTVQGIDFSNIITVVLDQSNLLLDYDKNAYTTVTIGVQEWIVENLKVTHFADGTLIPNILDSTEWTNPCVLNKKDEYGVLYNWYAAASYSIDETSIAPVGWHVPTLADLQTLRDTIGGHTNGGNLKETGTQYWQSPNINATNSTGFSARGSGYRIDNGVFTSLNQTLFGWTSDDMNNELGINWSLDYDSGSLNPQQFSSTAAFKHYGGAIRLIKDDDIDPGTLTDYDGNVYNTVKIGNQVWITTNLKVEHFNNGSVIDHVSDATDWVNLTTSGLCYYGNDETISHCYAMCWFDNNKNSYNVPYGALYNWYCVNRGSVVLNTALPYFTRDNIQEIGWKIPSRDDFNVLSSYLGGNYIASASLKETGFDHWLYPNAGATNSSGLTLLGAGHREGVNGNFSSLNNLNLTWSDTIYNVSASWAREALYDREDYLEAIPDNRSGFSVRCMRYVLLETPVALTATNETFEGFTANWEPVIGADYYQIYYSSDITFNVSSSINSVPGATSVDISSLDPSTYYYYQVRAINSLQQSDRSSIIMAQTIAISTFITIVTTISGTFNINLEVSDPWDPSSVIDWGDGTSEQVISGAYVSHYFVNGSTIMISNAATICYIEAAFNEITSIIGLECLINCFILFIWYNNFTEFIVPKTMISLQNLQIEGSQNLTTLIVPKECVSIREIIANSCSITTFTTHKEWVDLQRFEFHSNQLNEIVLYPEWTKLISLYLNNNNLTEVTLYPEWGINFGWVYVQNNQLSELTIYTEFQSMFIVSADDNDLSVTSVNNILIVADTLPNMKAPFGAVSLMQNAAPSGLGVVAKNSLISKGCLVLTS